MKALLAITLLTVTVGCSTINDYLGFEDDNMVEEYIEDRIEDGVGVDIDLTPFSQERA